MIARRANVVTDVRKEVAKFVAKKVEDVRSVTDVEARSPKNTNDRVS